MDGVDELRGGRIRIRRNPGILQPGDGFQLSVFFIVPPDAPLGTATWMCDVNAQGQVHHNLKENEIQTATFEVVP